jgi:septum formation protein
MQLESASGEPLGRGAQSSADASRGHHAAKAIATASEVERAIWSGGLAKPWSLGYLLFPAMGPFRLRAPLLLASGSPRRRELLESAGLLPTVKAVEIDETPLVGESPAVYLERIVAAKLEAARGLVEAAPPAVLLVADTTVVIDERVLGKPTSDEEAFEMVSAITGRRHQVRTRFAIARSGEPPEALTVVTEVEVRALDPRAIAAYVATGEGRDKAGAYAIQGHFGASVTRIDGSYTNVVGLPLAEVVELLERMGLVEPA